MPCLTVMEVNNGDYARKQLYVDKFQTDNKNNGWIIGSTRQRMYVVDWEYFHVEMMAVNHATVLPVNDEFLKGSARQNEIPSERKPLSI